MGEKELGSALDTRRALLRSSFFKSSRKVKKKKKFKDKPFKMTTHSLLIY